MARSRCPLRQEAPERDELAANFESPPARPSRPSGRAIRAAVVLVLLIQGSRLQGQSAAAKLSCSYSRHDNRTQGKKLSGGYDVSVGPSGGVEGDLDPCLGAIHDAAGKTVFQINGDEVVLEDDLAVEDFDQDGKAEVVFFTYAGGGQHCCWEYNVVSLFPRVHKLFDISGLVKLEKDQRGRAVIWQSAPGPEGFTSMARQPFAERVLRVKGGRLVDSTPEFCPRILAPGDRDHDHEMSLLTPEKLRQLSDAQQAPDEELVSALLSRALQNVFCGKTEEALRDLNLWPKATRQRLKMDFAQAIEHDYPVAAARISRLAASSGFGRPP